jgi:hypothetical protein
MVGKYILTVESLVQTHVVIASPTKLNTSVQGQ